ncbi:MAG: methyltransferase domain-containing protein [Nitrospirae bacterium]|nr:methyltransferase domain-containing protein [Nitrospirota bacterium]MBI5695194.1 methyltransferase domain-containing protein [Nitrospirota bacterium]
MTGGAVAGRLRPEDFGSWAEYYWTYQYNLARDWYVPMLAGWNVPLSGTRLLDVGCGDGGFTAALADAGADCTGVEIKPFAWREPGRPNLRYIVQDITAPDAVDMLGGQFDILVLRDVIEHIPAAMKAGFMRSALRLLKPSGRILLTFPPFWSPFGLHQQAELKTGFRNVPFLGWVPGSVLGPVLRAAGETESSIAAVEGIRGAAMSIGGFERLVRGLGLAIQHEKHYFVRPSHEIRYGWKCREAAWGGVPVLREVFVLGTVYVLGRDGFNL